MPVQAADQDNDLLGELLRPIRLTGVFQSHWLLNSPWSIEGDSESDCVVLHYVIEGSCWIGTEGARPVLLREGDLAVFPTGRSHRVSDHPDRRGVPLRTLLADRSPGISSQLALGGEGELTRILCAGLYYDTNTVSSLYHALPWMLTLEREAVEAEPLLRDIIHQLVTDRDGGLGPRLITLRIFEVFFILTLHPLLRGMMDRPEVITALKDPAISKALLIMYTRFVEPWTIESLAREVGMSRSAFAASFREIVGESPSSHLTLRRMRESARLLAESDVPLGVIPQKVGYKSAVGFHIAFRKCFGITPGEYRQRFRRMTGKTPAEDGPRDGAVRSTPTSWEGSAPRVSAGL
ncbi:AraC family transcriptional regulator [Parafrankia elaeagni]|uniref:AraC family transcriptional regulator n=1 Tax=Parafrankia elaeagni TaxID=222534 RepID=UPI000370EA5E|nr:AraC family transcriptional regulator [Parafrankia elaeagni]